MCGIAGVVGGVPDRADPVLVAQAMGDALAHRGPDGSGIWMDEAAGVTLIHRRLAIIDLSEGGRQPMVSVSGRYVIVFNGEIYNFQALRAELEADGTGFRSHSDTEVLLAAVERMGLDAALGRAAGMFAFALWDRQNRSLSLVRDRLGEKPLYWAPIGRGVAFASELRGLLAVPGAKFDIDRGSVALLLRHNYIPTPWSIYRGVYKLEPGTILRVTCTDGGSPICERRQYWDVTDALRRAKAAPFAGTLREAVGELDGQLSRTVREQMISDVPLGAFLSGGIDSSMVVAAMQAASTDPVETFSIGFHEVGYNEAVYAGAVAKHLGTRHTELYVTARDALDLIPDLPNVYDEPFADSSQIPTLLVCRMARRHVTVALSGDGGDEVFGGYNRYIWARDLWRVLGMMPLEARKALSALTRSVSTESWDRLASVLYRLVPAHLRYAGAGDRIHKAAELLAVPDAAALYRRMQSHWRSPDDVVVDGLEHPTPLSDRPLLDNSRDFIEYMMELDLRTYLLDDILVKVDRAAMSTSLETRIPLLDHRIVEFSASLPLEFRLQGRLGKRVLRDLLYRYVPRDLVDRPKSGFAMPIAHWLRGPLREWAENLLAPDRLRADGIFNPAPVRAMWEQHSSGRRSWGYHLWDVLMFQAWFHSQQNRAGPFSPSARPIEYVS